MQTRYTFYILYLFLLIICLLTQLYEILCTALRQDLYLCVISGISSQDSEAKQVNFYY
jgi:hypothetical protein